VTSSLAVFAAEIRVKSARLIKSRLKTRKKQRKYGNKRHFYIKLHLKDCFGMEFTTCSGELMPEETLTHLPYLMHIASLCVSRSY